MAKLISPKVGMARNSSLSAIRSFGEHCVVARDRTCCPGLKAWCIAAEIAGSKSEDRPRTRHDPAARPEAIRIALQPLRWLPALSVAFIVRAGTNIRLTRHYDP